MRKKIVCGLLILVGTLQACNKNDVEAKNIDIHFAEPQINDTIQSWNQLHVEGTITAEGEMNGYAISIVNVETGAVLYENTYDISAPAYNFHDHWMNNLQDTTKVIVNVNAFSKNELNNAHKSMQVMCLP